MKDTFTPDEYNPKFNVGDIVYCSLLNCYYHVEDIGRLELKADGTNETVVFDPGYTLRKCSKNGKLFKKIEHYRCYDMDSRPYNHSVGKG